MIQAEDFIKSALAKNYSFWTGVPCSILKSLISYVNQSPDVNYLGASSEGEAVGIAIGAYLTGKKTVVFCQNSGLGNTVNPITSLNHPFSIPTLFLVSYRGEPDFKDEPQHLFMGTITEDILTTMHIPWAIFPDRIENINEAFDKADEYITKKGLPYALIIKKGTVVPYTLRENMAYERCLENTLQGEFNVVKEKRMPRFDAIKIIRNSLVNGELIIGTTGKIGRELFALGHSANQFYVVGGMGCAAAIGLGLSLCQKKHRVVVLDGDGAVLMKMGVLATIGHSRPKNLIHIILDNEVHESTGGQPTVSGCIDFAKIASACSYKAIFRCDTAVALKEIVKTALNSEGPVMIHVKIAKGSAPNLGRPTLTPIQVKKQFMRYIAQSGEFYEKN